MKPSKIFVKPARPGMNLRHPVSGELPDGGRRWLDDSFTRRRIADGGIFIVPDEPVGADDQTDQPVQPVRAVAAAPAAPPATPTAGVK